VVTHGTVEIDGELRRLANNVWIVGDDEHAVVVDAAHDAEAILEGVGGRELVAILCTHGHGDHVNAVGELYEATGATEFLHPADVGLWLETYAEPEPEHELEDGDILEIGDVEIEVLHTPGHTPGSCCFLAEGLGVVFTGDTLLSGGAGPTDAWTNDPTELAGSVRDRLLPLPVGTVVLPGHGEPTTIGADAANAVGLADGVR
jgi:glyoxylase-like metal-dependent hydrolase (beta-lactamase superfamily II)